MKLSRSLYLAVCLAFATIVAYAADVSGKWVAQVPGRGGQMQDVTFDFKVSGDQLTGTVTNPRGESPISDGKIEGDTISFVQVLNFNGNEMKILYKGKVAGDEIKFTRQREGGDRVSEFTAKRSS
jgi:hypothetical protein